MITVEHNGKTYAYINKHDCWVDSVNKKIQIPELADNLRQVALDTGYTEIDFIKPVAELEKYLNKEPITKTSKQEDKKTTKKSTTAISLMDIINKKKGE